MPRRSCHRLARLPDERLYGGVVWRRTEPVHRPGWDVRRLEADLDVVEGESLVAATLVHGADKVNADAHAVVGAEVA